MLQFNSHQGADARKLNVKFTSQPCCNTLGQNAEGCLSERRCWERGIAEQSTHGCQSRRRAGKSKSTQFAWHSPPLTITNADMPSIGASKRRTKGSGGVEWLAGLAGIAVMAKTADKSAALPPCSHTHRPNFRVGGVVEIALGNGKGGSFPSHQRAN